MTIMNFTFYLFCITCAVLINNVDSFKILQITSVPSKSHYFLASALANGLGEAGHNVTLVTAFEAKVSKDDKFKLITLNGLIKSLHYELPGSILSLGNKNAFWKLWFTCFLGNLVTRKVLEHTKFQEILQSNETYDAIILEQFSNDALKIVGHKLNAPLIMFHSVGATSAVNPLVGNPSPSSYVSDILLSYPSRMSFWERLENFAVKIFAHVYRQLYFFPKQNEILKEFHPDAPHLSTLYHNVSLVFLMSHESTHQAVPLVPNMINIGGFHLKPAEELGPHLKKFLDAATEGVVYFGMGTNVKLSTVRNDTKSVLLNGLGKLKQKVLMQWDEEIPKNVPGNIKMLKWFPQQAILAHPNTKLFVSHAGLLSYTESVRYGVPILAMPVFADQKLNANFAEEEGFGLQLSLLNLTEENFGHALNELLNNPKYLQNARRQSAVTQDRPMTPLQTAVYWVEFVCRHRGAQHLRVAGIDLPFYQYYMIDVISLLIAGVVSVWLTLFTIFCTIRKLLRPAKNVKKQNKKKTN